MVVGLAVVTMGGCLQALVPLPESGGGAEVARGAAVDPTPSTGLLLDQVQDMLGLSNRPEPVDDAILTHLQALQSELRDTELSIEADLDELFARAAQPALLTSQQAVSSLRFPSSSPALEHRWTDLDSRGRSESGAVPARVDSPVSAAHELPAQATSAVFPSRDAVPCVMLLFHLPCFLARFTRCLDPASQPWKGYQCSCGSSAAELATEAVLCQSTKGVLLCVGSLSTLLR